MLTVAEVRENTRNKVPFKFAVVTGTGDADHASHWSFDDEQVVRDRWWHPKTGEVVLDIGAAFGSYTLPALAMGARVVAFSPADFDTELLNKNLSLNPELARRCLVVRDGVYSRDGWFQPDRCEFEQADRAPHGGLFGSSGMSGWLPVRALDSFLAERPGIERVDWIKMDIEGAELEALKGAEQTLRRWHPRVVVELHKQHIPMIETDVINFMCGLGEGYRFEGPMVHVPGSVVTHAYFEAAR